MNGRYLCACICARGKDIAAVLGAKTRGDGCIKGNGVAVSWGGGRTPTENSSSRCLWRAPEKLELDILTILPAEWKVLVKPKTADQFKIVKQLLKQATELVIATDADRGR